MVRRKRRLASRARTLARVPSAPADDPADWAGSPAQQAGARTEHLARAHLEAAGLHFIAANLRCRAGELDLVMRDAGTLIFIEVRLRHNRAFGGAAASVNRHKQARLQRAAQYFLPRLIARQPALGTLRCRFDVLASDGRELIWIRDAFVAQQNG